MSYKSMLEGPSTKAYTSSLMGWADRNGFGDNSYLKSLISSDMPDQLKYQFVSAFGENRKEVAAKSEGDEMLYLIPEERSDGGFHYVNRMTGRIEAIVEKLPNGMFSFYGPARYMTRLGGRAELSGIVDRMADGKYFNKS